LNKNRPRLKDIADELNVSPSTVSRALSNDDRISKDISKEVRLAVMNLAKKLGYTRNPFAFNLHERTSTNIGLILPEFTHHYFSKVLKGVDSVVKEHGYHLMINTHNDDYEKEQRAVTALNSSLVQGILVAYAGNNQGFQLYKDSIARGVPVVFFDRLCEEIEASYVVTDDFGGAILAIDQLARTGCRRIAYFGGPEDISTNFNRQMGYLEGLKKNGIELSNNMMFPWEADELKRKTMMRAFISANELDGIFCFSDYIAYDVLCILESQGIRVPDQISIIGFAGEPISEISRPRISTVHQPAELVGQRAAEILLWHFDHPDDRQIITEILATDLVLRDTTKKIV
jgi:DNA-binding LacI/PurR family transcriptional regulator